MKPVFAFEAYQDYVRARIETAGVRTGYHARMAEAARCKSSYLSQVLAGAAHLTPDHAAELCAFWAFSEAETDYFMALVDLGRAGSPRLRQRLEAKLKEWRKAAQSVKEVLKAGNDPGITMVAPDDAGLTAYYASWLPAAVHIALRIEALRTAPAIAARFRISLAKAHAVLAQLAALGCAANEGEHWRPLRANIHLPSGSPVAAIGQRNWRYVAADRCGDLGPDDLQYSAIYSLRRRDFQDIRAAVVDVVRQSREIVTKSADEELAVMVCDWFVI